MTILFQKQFKSQYEFRFFGVEAPEKAANLSLTGLFDNTYFQSVRLVVDADMSNPYNKSIKLQASRDMAAKILRAARAERRAA